MSELLIPFSTWGAVLTIAAFGLFSLIQKKTKSWLNPLLLSAVLIGALLLIGRIPYSQYKSSTSAISYLLLPATVSLAIPLYEQWPLLKKHWLAILCGIGAGAVTSLLCAILLSRAFQMDRALAVTFLPKSVTTAIGMDVAAELGGIPSLSIVLIVLTGITGNIAAPALCRLLGLKSAIARGIATGTASHAIGTAKAMEMGEVEGAMSGLSIAVAGVLTAFLAPLAAALL